MKQWQFIPISQAINSIPECIIDFISPAEDYVTEQICVSVQGSAHKLYVRGFRTDGVEVAKSDNMIEMVEVTTGYSDGDRPLNDLEYCIIHAKVKIAIMRLGYQTVNSLDPYF